MSAGSLGSLFEVRSWGESRNGLHWHVVEQDRQILGLGAKAKLLISLYLPVLLHCCYCYRYASWRLQRPGVCVCVCARLAEMKVMFILQAPSLTHSHKTRICSICPGSPVLH